MKITIFKFETCKMVDIGRWTFGFDTYYVPKPFELCRRGNGWVLKFWRLRFFVSRRPNAIPQPDEPAWGDFD